MAAPAAMFKKLCKKIETEFIGARLVFEEKAYCCNERLMT